MGSLFGTDGIRGIANIYPMDAKTALLAGRAVAQQFRNQNNNPSIVIGQDTRLSGDMISRAVAAGVCSAGVDAVFLGIIPTPAVAYLACATGAVAGIMISASHNPFADNGIKVFNSEGYKLNDSLESEIEKRIIETSEDHVPPDRIGRIRSMNNSEDKYINFLMQAVPGLDLNNKKIVFDCANGATFTAAPVLFERLGADAVFMYCSPDGVNINSDCGSEHPAALSKAVIDHKADLGLAYDGDGDRLIAVDENGKVLTGDQIMVICAKQLYDKGKLNKNMVVSTVMSNLGFHKALDALGIEPAITPVGDRYVLEKMIAQDALLGGEDSGHMIFKDVHTTGDGMMASLRLIEALISESKPLSELSKLMTVYPQKLINVDVKDKPDLQKIPQIVEIIKKVEKDLGDQGRVLVRYSGTQNKCRVMVEGPTIEKTQAQCKKIVQVIRDVLG
ncbi:MAG: phosphoglucosamine mutase [Desulfobacteraceae bacterium]|nr:phosphoglucosamine mutase [Desulfobacteraceae bacterium]